MAKNKNVLELVYGDDFVEYYIFPKYDFNDNEIELLNCLISNVNAFLEKYIRGYIWHRDQFNLVARNSSTLLNNNLQETIPPHLYGITYYGDNIEDEWFIVFLLNQLSREFEELIIRVIDNDGEFLLIEAANYLPEWADPETCSKRVYINKGCLHIVAPEIDDDNEESITVENAINEIRKNSSLTVASGSIQACITKRIQGYPDSVKENQHQTSVYVPIAVASILRANPQLISPAVQAFCSRDQIDMKACRAMKYFPPEIRVLTSVTFTKCLYAMLINSKYQPERKTGWNLPLPSSKIYKAHNLGVKLACGFEILVSQAKVIAGDENDKDWKAYQQKLQEKGYFKDLLEHSKEYNQLLNKAKEYYANYKGSHVSNTSIGQELLKLLQSLDHNPEEFKQAGTNLPADDDDSWLNISPQELNEILEEQYGSQSTITLNGETDPIQFTENLTTFLNHVSSLEGAEFPQKTDEIPEETASKVNFDPSSFACAVQNILNFAIPEDDSWDFDTDSDMSDYDVDENGTNGELNKMQELMDAMDKELAKTTIGESFLKKEDAEGFEDIEAFKPVNIDMNALKNILESYKSQLGEAGPSSNMLGPMGIHLNETKGESPK
ncbi:sgt1 protein hsgt1 suppressor of gcr2 [Holotrichia oblita]|uniref:Sgt1 protein hsgt1 suppressor of gcr2 n=1 Tax=Holotrichia oblita TaxID=644536 RepID=A0ACB9TWA9_HOLOL|nr:sgt1 protein hsgt1 suppressor of gcr2 [Holotrichia oblita]